MDNSIGVNTVINVGVNMDINRVNEVISVTDRMMREQPKDELGRFVSQYDEPLSKKVVGVRLQESVYERLLDLAQEQDKSPGEILRELAIAALTQKDSQSGQLSEDTLKQIRDTVLSKLKLGKQSQGAKAINQFIKELRD